MKKAQLEIELKKAMSIIDKRDEACRGMRYKVKGLEDEVVELDKYKKATERALVAIEAIIVVGCPAIKAWNEQSQWFHELAQKGENIPDKPEDKMYEALGHLQQMLNMPSVSAKNIGYSRFS